jgi:hypothetical protein
VKASTLGTPHREWILLGEAERMRDPCVGSLSIYGQTEST